jgi:tRNA CCA-adding enzyme
MKNIIPSKDEKKKLKKTVKGFLDSFKDEGDVKFFLGGSYAKDTYLPGNRDIDVFVKFNYKTYKDQDISAVLYVMLRKKFKEVTIVHGSRDYYHILINDIIFEVVPVLDIKKASDAVNVMDVSPLHVAYVKKKLKKKDDVRKLKALLKANHLYGAESYLQGFSGYVLEILVAHYGSFDKVIKAFSKVGDSLVLDPAKHYSSKAIALKSLNKSKLGAFVLIDPVQPDRNVAAGVSLLKLQAFISLCKVYDGSDSWFVLENIDVSKLKGYIVLDVVGLPGKQDISLSKMRALYDRILREFTYKGFSVVDSGWDASHYWFKVSKLPKKFKHYGPDLKYIEHVAAFKKKYGRKAKVSKDKVYVDLDREFWDPKEFLKFIVKQKFVKEKIKSISLS